MYYGFHKNIKQLFLALIIIRNVFWAPVQNITMISEVLCDKETGEMDAKTLALPTQEQIMF